MKIGSRSIKYTLFAALLCAFATCVRAAGTFASADDRAADIDCLITPIETRYAYLPERHLDLTKMRALFVPEAGGSLLRRVNCQKEAITSACPTRGNSRTSLEGLR